MLKQCFSLLHHQRKSLQACTCHHLPWPVQAILDAQGDKSQMNAGCRYLSYLPLAHIYERILALKIQFLAGSMAFYRCPFPPNVLNITALRRFHVPVRHSESIAEPLSLP